MSKKPTYEELEQSVKELEKEAVEYKLAKEEVTRLLKTIETSREAINITSPDGIIMYTNPAMNELFGYKRGELLGKNPSRLNAGPKPEVTTKNIMKAIDKEGVWEGEIHNRRKDGTEFTSYARITVARDEDGKATNYLSTQHDITERKRAEKALRESEEKSRTFMGTASDLMLIADKDGNFTYVNDSMARTLRYSKEEMIGMNIRQILSKETLEKYYEQRIKKLITKGEIGVESIWITKDGKEICGEIKVIAIYDNNGKFVGGRGVLRDTTERKLAEQALRDKEEELEIKNKSLEEVNAALRVLLKKRDEDKKEIEEKVLLNMKELVIPYLEKLKNNGLNTKQKAYTSIIESNLKDIISPFSRRLSSKYLNFTPREIQVADLVKHGKTTKEIAELLNSSPKPLSFTEIISERNLMNS